MSEDLTTHKPAVHAGPAAPEWLEGSWVSCSYSSFTRQRLQTDDNGLLTVVSSQGWGAYAMAFFMMGIGAVLACMAANAGLSFWKSAPGGWMGAATSACVGAFVLVFCGMGLLFVLFALLLAWPPGRGAAFDTLARACRHVRTPFPAGALKEAKFSMTRESFAALRARRETELPFADVLGIQLLSKEEKMASSEATWSSKTHQLNLVLKDRSRLPVMCHGDRAAMEEDARTLAKWLRVQVWAGV